MNLIKEHFPTLSAKQYQQIEHAMELYQEWNLKINMISRKDMVNLEERHFLHSLGIAKVTSFKKGTKILDLGTGGGFPGIPLAILFPEVDFHLVDCIGKKIKVVDTIADELNLVNVQADHKRAEELKSNYDFVVSRAVTRLPVIYNWINEKIFFKSNNEFKNGILYLKGGEIEDELAELGKENTIYPLSEHFKQEFFETKFVVHIPI
ncbi:MAG: 16S rRNA (guanine527-N7)-methyltransferase [Sphingobacteriales bacterium]|jgi:16S rRNA (guanine527-N7)-methyltransferase